MQDEVHGFLQLDALCDVVLPKAEERVPPEVGQVLLPSGQEVVEGLHLPPFRQEPVTEVGTQKPRGPGDQHPHARSASLCTNHSYV